MSGFTITYRPMELADLGKAPISHQGDADEVATRIADLGSSAILAFDGAQHVGQLQFRRHLPAAPADSAERHYWDDFGTNAPPVPDGAITICCYHVGQTDDTETRDTRYQGRGIGLALLDALIAWADERGIPAILAKAMPPYVEVMRYMGGQPGAVYEERGFATISSWVEERTRADLLRAPQSQPPGVDLSDAARVSCCVRLRP